MKSLRQQKKAAVRAKIISTAIELFSRHGLAGVTVEHIADVAQIGKGTTYNYFATKEDIVVAYLAGIEARLQAKVMKFVTAKRSLESLLSGYIRFNFREKRDHHGFVRVFLAQMFSRTEQFLPYMIEMQKAIDPPLEKLFRTAQERKLIRRDVKIPELIVTFKTIHLGLTALWAFDSPPFHAAEAVLKLEIKLFCEGLEARHR